MQTRLEEGWMRVLWVVTIAILLGTSARGQSPTATLVGTVRDATGAGVYLAALRLRNVATNEVRRGQTSAAGEYTAPNLPAGEYECIVDKEGFRALRQTGIELQIDQVARLDLQLEVGAISESVEVHATASLLNTENPVRGAVMVGKEVLEMPLNGRDFSDLALGCRVSCPRRRAARDDPPSTSTARAPTIRTSTSTASMTRTPGAPPRAPPPRRVPTSMRCSNSRCRRATTRPSMAGWRAA